MQSFFCAFLQGHKIVIKLTPFVQPLVELTQKTAIKVSVSQKQMKVIPIQLIGRDLEAMYESFTSLIVELTENGKVAKKEREIR